MATDREETLKRIDEFNKRAEALKRSSLAQPPDVPDISAITPAGMKGPLTDDQKRIMAAPEDSLSAADKIERQALRTQAELERENRDRARAEQQRQREETSNIQKVQDAGQRVANAALDAAEPPIKWFENRPTPFGIGVIIAIIVVFLLAIVPVDDAGNTRLKLIFLTLSGKTHLSYQDTQQGAAGASGNFGNQSTPSVQPRQTAQNVPIDLSSVPDLSGIDFTNL